jgi:hypothetical protein
MKITATYQVTSANKVTGTVSDLSKVPHPYRGATDADTVANLEAALTDRRISLYDIAEQLNDPMITYSTGRSNVTVQASITVEQDEAPAADGTAAVETTQEV